ncbi:hypothetical protein [Labilibaculum antarcticum]|uniref:hypothetical protein n=1 Tax=Labilibaculum antarcticum TaxID=1717717 RepID=UPI0011AB47B7|nr:hypothetical protein [Labilibaculum antarcticum]
MPQLKQGTNDEPRSSVNSSIAFGFNQRILEKYFDVSIYYSKVQILRPDDNRDQNDNRILWDS